jgi:hypothetical protein
VARKVGSLIALGNRFGGVVLALSGAAALIFNGWDMIKTILSAVFCAAG